MGKFKDRTDVQFITFNMDENPGLIEPVMRQLGLSLTVVPAYRFVTDTLKVVGIPQNWIVDGTGTIQAKGWDAEAGSWEAGMSEAIEKYRSESGSH
jgi:hypothetical protein